MSFLQGPLIHELSLGSPLRRVTQSTGSVQASLAEINVSTHLLLVRGASASPSSPGLELLCIDWQPHERVLALSRVATEVGRLPETRLKCHQLALIESGVQA